MQPGVTAPGIHSAILGVMADIGRRGIAKASRNEEQKYNFRGIEAAMNQLAPILREHAITVTVRYSDVQFSARPTKSGGESRFAVVKGLFRFTAEDQTFVESEYYGEGMDSGDKALTKAQSVAYRTALFQQFIVPTMAIDPETGEVVLTRGEELQEIADSAIQKFNDGNEWGAYEEIKGIKDNEELLKVWSILRPHSKLRAAMKKLAEAERKGEKKPIGSQAASIMDQDA